MELLDAIEYGSTACHICPNRVWGIGSRFDDWETQLPRLLQQYGKYIGRAIDAQEHMACTVEFCERSALNFTNVKQRHEPLYCLEPCYRLQGLFDERVLVKVLSLAESRPTAWALDGMSIVGPAQPFMAISHVWSDGTGMGGWPAGEVNACLFQYFEQIALSFQCEGIWWDAVCLPNSKDARSAAVNNMDINYQNATVTLVHDCFLRRLPWTEDPNAACFAIIMSPWFSRGWTALELARSPSVKIVFAEDKIVDLDADILDVVENDNPAANSIRALRRPIEQLDDLLDVLGSRHTSWTRDMAVIAGLLSGVSTASGSQRAIYQAILLRIGQLSPGHLFHKHTTMSGSFSWCPTSLFQFPRARGEGRSMLRVTNQGELRGSWKLIHLDAIPVDTYVWGLSHPLVERAMQAALADKRMCILLAESTAESVGRGILVRLWKQPEDSSKLKCQYLGSLFFHPRIALPHAPHADVVIGDVEGWQQLGDGEDAWNMLRRPGRTDNSSPASSHGDISMLPSNLTSGYAETSLTEPKPSTGTGSGTVGSIRLARPTPERNRPLPDGRPAPICMARNRISEMRNAKQNISSRNQYGRTLLHWAAEVGDMQTFQLMLHAFRTEGASLADTDSSGRNCLHVAIRNNQRGVVRVLLNLKLHLDMIRAQDMWGQTALHLAVARNDPMVIQWLLEEMDSATLRLEDRLGSTALGLAARCLFEAPITTILHKYVADGSIYTRDRSGKTVLHHAARNANLQAVEFLLSLWPEEHITAQSRAGDTALHLAARRGNLEVVRALIGRWPREQLADLSGSGENALHLAAGDRGCVTIELLADCWPQEHITARTSEGETALDIAVLRMNTQAVKVLLDRWSPELLIAASEVSDEDSLLFRTACHDPSIFSLLVDLWPKERRTIERDACTKAFYSVCSNHQPGSAEALETLLDWTPLEDIIAPSDAGHTALHLAVASEKSLHQLLTRWPPKLLTATTKDWAETALHLAAEGGYAESIRLLLERWPPKKLTTKTSRGETALHLAVKSGNSEAVGALLDHWPPKYVSAKTASGRTVFELAARRKCAAVLKLLDDRIPGRPRSVHISDNNLQVSRVDAELAAMQRILGERLPHADRDTVAWFAAAPLHDAAASGRTGDVQVLMERLPQDFVTVTTYSEETALHLSAQGGHIQTVEALCRRWPREHMADLSAAGFTALHIAVASDHLEMAEVLLRHCPEIAAARAEDGRTALHVAASRGNLAMLELLIPRLSGEDLHAVDIGRVNALRLAAESGKEACVQLLLQWLSSGPKGAPAASGRWSLVGAISAAVRGGNEAIVRMLMGSHSKEEFQSIWDELQFLAEDKSSSPEGAARGRIEGILRLL